LLYAVKPTQTLPIAVYLPGKITANTRHTLEL
jgi:hypothetical protein